MHDRWHLDPSLAGRIRGAEKGGPALEPGDHALGYSRGGYGTKLLLLTDSRGHPIAIAVRPGQEHESKSVEALLDSVRIRQTRGRPRKRPKILIGDKGYSYPGVRRLLHRRGIRPLIPLRRDQVLHHRGRWPFFDRTLYGKRHIVENCIGWLKEMRRIATRFEKLAVNFLAMAKLACLWRYLTNSR